MKAVEINKTGGPEVLEVKDITLDKPGPDQVTIEQKAIGLNYIDTYHRSGLYPLKLPIGLGLEGAGIINEVGENVKEFKVGDKISYAGIPLGSYCSHRNYPIKNLVKVPDGIDLEIAATLMNSNCARIFHDHILVKEPGNSVVTPWHQDQPYYLCEGEQTVSFWVPLDYIPRDRSIEYIAGSHAWDKNFKPQRFDGSDLFEGDKSEVVPDVDNMRDQFNIIGWEMEPGDAVAFHFRTLHGAPANSSKSRRRVISIRWVGDDAKFVKRLGPTSPSFPELTFEDGEPFAGEDFPIIFDKNKIE